MRAPSASLRPRGRLFAQATNLAHLRQLPNGVNTDLGELRAGDRAHSPHQLDGKVVEEIQLSFGIDNH